jgi:hypothetical protein
MGVLLAVPLFLIGPHRPLFFFVLFLAIVLAIWTVAFVALGYLLWWVNEAAFARYYRQGEAPRQSRVPGSPTEHAVGDRGHDSVGQRTKP